MYATMTMSREVISRDQKESSCLVSYSMARHMWYVLSIILRSCNFQATHGLHEKIHPSPCSSQLAVFLRSSNHFPWWRSSCRHQGSFALLLMCEWLCPLHSPMVCCLPSIHAMSSSSFVSTVIFGGDLSKTNRWNLVTPLCHNPVLHDCVPAKHGVWRIKAMLQFFSLTLLSYHCDEPSSTLCKYS